MRKCFDLMENWKFVKEDVGCETAMKTTGETVTLPHTWNAKDGQDGGNDYYRGRCWYVRKFDHPTLSADEELWVEFEAVAMRAVVYLNGAEVGRHDGGYSTFRCDLTAQLQEHNVLAVSADNGANREVYPQKADFTFYGGIYRAVRLIQVPRTHFALGYYGAPGIAVTPRSYDLSSVDAAAWIEGAGGDEVLRFMLRDADGQVVAGTKTSVPAENMRGDGTCHVEAKLELPQVHLWDGVEDPYLYTCDATLLDADGTTLDVRTIRFGCRTFSVDPERGFLLNGRAYPLCGAARHQDREGFGNALTRKMHEEDVALLREMGANTVRLAHYQHDQYFYDLCDETGLIVWAEIPYITEHMPEGRQNTLDQMRELILQCKHHPAIVCWGLSNEITGAGKSDDLVENHQELNDLCHRLDPMRPTTMAHVFMLSADDPLVLLPDIRSYNLYYGWYLGELSQNDEWFDTFHKKHPDAAIGLSEYGADANPLYQSANPQKGDWTEGYQALYHEHMLKMWSERPYIWSMMCWNMFDFGADGRDEGGKPGQNQKGLVTFDRRIRKDAFYIYKAYLSDDPFVHLCGRRYADRAEEETEIRVYSNQMEVALLVDGEAAETKTGNKVFVFRVPLTGEHVIEALAGDCRDRMVIRRVESPNPSYVKEGSEIVNWFDRDDEIVREGYYSIKDAMSAIKDNPEAKAVFDRIVAPLQERIIAKYGDVARAVTMPPELQRQMDAMSVEATLKQMGAIVTPDIVHQLNGELNQIRKV